MLHNLTRALSFRLCSTATEQIKTRTAEDRDDEAQPKASAARASAKASSESTHVGGDVACYACWHPCRRAARRAGSSKRKRRWWNRWGASQDRFVDTAWDWTKPIYIKRLPNELPKIVAFLSPWQAELAGVAEAAFNCYWLVDGSQEAGFPVHLAHTTAIRKYDGLAATKQTRATWPICCGWES